MQRRGCVALLPFVLALAIGCAPRSEPDGPPPTTSVAEESQAPATTGPADPDDCPDASSDVEKKIYLDANCALRADNPVDPENACVYRGKKVDWDVVADADCSEDVTVSVEFTDETASVFTDVKCKSKKTNKGNGTLKCKVKGSATVDPYEYAVTVAKEDGSSSSVDPQLFVRPSGDDDAEADDAEDRDTEDGHTDDGDAEDGGSAGE